MGDTLKGRVAVITGAGNGLGRADAISFAAQGASIVVNDLGTAHDGYGSSHNDADRVVERIRNDGGVAVADYASVATEEGARSIIQQAVDEFGRVDILVNNAGVIRHQAVDAIVTEDWDLNGQDPPDRHDVLHSRGGRTHEETEIRPDPLHFVPYRVGFRGTGGIFNGQGRHRRIRADHSAGNGRIRRDLQYSSPHSRLARGRSGIQESEGRGSSA